MAVNKTDLLPMRITSLPAILLKTITQIHEKRKAV